MKNDAIKASRLLQLFPAQIGAWFDWQLHSIYYLYTIKDENVEYLILHKQYGQLFDS